MQIKDIEDSLSFKAKVTLYTRPRRSDNSVEAIIEFKLSKSESEMENEASEAKNQIETREYYKELLLDKVSNSILWKKQQLDNHLSNYFKLKVKLFSFSLFIASSKIPSSSSVL